MHSSTADIRPATFPAFSTSSSPSPMLQAISDIRSYFQQYRLAVLLAPGRASDEGIAGVSGAVAFGAARSDALKGCARKEDILLDLELPGDAGRQVLERHAFGLVYANFAINGSVKGFILPTFVDANAETEFIHQALGDAALRSLEGVRAALVVYREQVGSVPRELQQALVHRMLSNKTD